MITEQVTKEVADELAEASNGIVNGIYDNEFVDTVRAADLHQD